jgi:hypothetical protein
MRGSGGAFGFLAISDLGAGLEQAAGDADFGASRRLLNELSGYLEKQN